MLKEDSVNEALGEIFNSIIKATKQVNQIFPRLREFKVLDFGGKRLRSDGDKIKEMLWKLKKPDEDLEPFENDERFESVVDLLDQYLENVDTFLDHTSDDHSKILRVDQTHRSYIEKIRKPQIEWIDDIDNAPETHFKPKLTNKPHDTVLSLEESLSGKHNSKISKNGVTLINDFSLLRLGYSIGSGGPPDLQSAPHPYHQELKALLYQDWQLNRNDKTPLTTSACVNTGEIIVRGLKEVSCHWIDTPDKLLKMSQQLDKEQMIAIDLELHTHRTYQGYVCLMQISTTSEDFLIDTLVLRKEMSILNNSFANPKIQKVMHGADNDILWLQRDFGLYIVNLFDTGQAARFLEFQASLAFLLKKFCDINADKKFQLADWRMRPLPEGMMLYARQDTHYLLYIYDQLKQLLLDKGIPIINVLNKSKEICMCRYEKPFYIEPSSTMMGCVKNEGVFRFLHKWRDDTARKEDESVKYVLPTHMLVTIADQAPNTVKQLLACCNPVPPLVRRDREYLLRNILALKATSATSTTIYSGGVPVNSNCNSITSMHQQSSSLATGGMDSATKVSQQLDYDTIGWVNSVVEVSDNRNNNGASKIGSQQYPSGLGVASTLFMGGDDLPTEKKIIETIEETTNSILFGNSSTKQHSSTSTTSLMSTAKHLFHNNSCNNLKGEDTQPNSSSSLSKRRKKSEIDNEDDPLQVEEEEDAVVILDYSTDHQHYQTQLPSTQQQQNKKEQKPLQVASVLEIYGSNNSNRIKGGAVTTGSSNQKPKKLLKQELLQSAVDSEQQQQHRQQQNNSSNVNSVGEFLKQLGWIDPSESNTNVAGSSGSSLSSRSNQTHHQQHQQQQQHHHQQPSTSAINNRKQKTGSFDESQPSTYTTLKHHNKYYNKK